MTIPVTFVNQALKLLNTYFCPVVQELWFKLSQKMKPFLDINPHLKPHSVLLGCLDCSNQMCLNHIFNILKNIYVFHEMQ